MPRLTGTAQPIPLGEGYMLNAPGIQGDATLKHAHTIASVGRSSEEGTTALDEAFASTNVTEVRQVEVRVQPAAGPTPQAPLRSADNQEVMELQVPDLGPETGQIVLACDESGVLTWHLPADQQVATTVSSSRGGGLTKKFLIPAAIAPEPAGHGGQRSLVGAIGRKLLKVLVYPVTDPIFGAVSDLFAHHWEARNRPYGLRKMSPGDFRQKDAGEIRSEDWARLSSGRALLMVHGTFSTAHGAFAGIPDATFGELHTRYEGRIFALNHPTLGDDPRRNVEWLLSNIPADVRLNVDIVSHSRGGLVARTLAERPPVFGINSSNISVKRVVFVGVPNQGTILAEPDHMVKMLDRFTSVLNFFPTGPVTEVLEAIITVVKMLGHGALKGLDGLAVMRPKSQFLETLNAGNPSGLEYFGVAADYEPQDQAFRSLVRSSIKNAVMDRVFEQTANDLVVPEAGVYSKNGSNAFPIPEQHLLRLPAAAGVMHTTMFGHPATSERLTQWLSA
jgi:pimeloyl-ACP methyl ester carboxylesterase